MIARGDLAVEVGFERLSEVVRQILALCEAAHVPAIWATQVLETLAKTGAPSRAEVTDAAAAQRAECVMLNKGPYILDAIRALGRHPRVRGRGATEEPDPDATHSLLGRAIESPHCLALRRGLCQPGRRFERCGVLGPYGQQAKAG